MLARCPRCDKPYVDTGAGRCPRCGEAVAPGEGGAPPEAAPPEAPQPHAVVVEGGADGPTGKRPKRGIPPVPPRFLDGRPAFEDRARSLPARYFGTLADACLRPPAFFTHLSREGARGITWFAYASVLLGTALGAAWNLALLPVWRALIASSTQNMRPEDLAALEEAAKEGGLAKLLLDSVQTQGQVLAQLPLLEAQLWTTLLLAPVTAFFTIHLLAGLLHFSVQPFRSPADEPVPYEATYRFTVYALAPMLLTAIPTVGGLAGVFTLAVLGIAMARLLRLRALGVIGGVLSPVLLLSFLWNQEVLPRAAPHVAALVGVVVAPVAAEEPTKAPPGADGAAAGAPEDLAALAALPPTPPAGRDHSVEIAEVDGFLETARVFRSSRGPLEIRHRARTAEAGEVAVEVRVRNAGELALDVGVEHPPAGALVPGSLAVRPERAPAQPTEDARAGTAGDGAAGDGAAGDGAPVRVRFASLAPGAEAVLSFRVRGIEPATLLQTGPSVALEGP